MERISSHQEKGRFKMKIETLLHDEIENEFGELKKMQLGTDEYKTTVDGLTKLVDKAIELEKNNAEHQEHVESRKVENDLKQQQIDDEKKDRAKKNVIAVAGIVIPSVITVWGTLKSLKFEEEGTVTTIMGRGFINKLLPKK